MPQRAGALDRQRQRAAEQARGRSGRTEGRPCALFPLFDAMTGVAGPQLVAAVTRQRDGHELARRFRHVVGRDGGGVGERLVEVPGERRQQRHDVGRHRARVELAAEVFGDRACVRELVVGRVIEADRNRLRRQRARLDHVRRDRARVDAAGQEGAERHVRDLPQRHRFRQQRVELLEVLAFARRVAVAREGQVPVARRPEGAVLGDEHVPGLELVNAFVDGAWRRHVEQGEIFVDGLRTPLARHVGILEQRLQLRAEDQAAAGQLRVVERLHADAIPREQQAALPGVPDGEREHAAEALDRAVAPFLVAVDDDLGVGAGAEAMAARRQVRPHVGEVVDLAVEDGPDGAVFVAERLIAGREIDDAEPPVSEPDAGRDVIPGGVGSTMRDRVGHRGQHAAVDRTKRVVVEAPGYAAHG